MTILGRIRHLLFGIITIGIMGDSNNNDTVNSNNNNNNTNASSTTATTHNSNNTVKQGGDAGIASNTTLQSDPVLHRLKELEDSNIQNSKALEKLTKELQEKEDRIKLLSADKRKEMEKILSNAIDNWLNSLSGVSDENKASFRDGISKLAERADMNNAAWEIVCNASELHTTNVKKIEELVQQAKDRDRELGDLQGFKSEASRISGIKRGRTEESRTIEGESLSKYGRTTMETTNNNTIAQETAGGGGGGAWDMFESMIKRDSKTKYY